MSQLKKWEEHLDKNHVCCLLDFVNNLLHSRREGGTKCFLANMVFYANLATVIIDRSIILRLLARIKFSAPEGLANSTMAVPFSLTLMVLTLPQAVVMALILSKLIMGGKLEIITR